MTEEQIFEKLCYYDRRNPLFNELGLGDYDDDDIPIARRDGCSCDNCFYGKDKLAVELLKMKAALEQISVESMEGCEDCPSIAQNALDSLAAA